MGRVRKIPIWVRTFWNFKLKVLNYSRNCSLHATLIPNSVKPLTYIHSWIEASNWKLMLTRIPSIVTVAQMIFHKIFNDKAWLSKMHIAEQNQLFWTGRVFHASFDKTWHLLYFWGLGIAKLASAYFHDLAFLPGFYIHWYKLMVLRY